MKMKQNNKKHQLKRKLSKWQKDADRRAKASLNALREGLLLNIKTE